MKKESKDRMLRFIIVIFALVIITCVILLSLKACDKTEQVGGNQPTSVMTPTNEPNPTSDVKATVTPESTQGAESTPSVQITSSPEVTPDAETTIVPEPTPDTEASVTPTITPTQAVTPTQAPTGEAVPTKTPTQTLTPTKKPTQTVAPTKRPTATPTKKATPTPTKKPSDTSGKTPVAIHGALSVSGTNLVDKNGDVFQLKGVSTHGLQWFPQYVNKATFQTIRDEWGANVIRLAMYTAEGGYCEGSTATKNKLKKLVTDGVSYATDLGMYVIIDWHVLNDQNPAKYKTEAKAFFKEMAQKYKDNNNVIYEICNEPNGGVTWSQVKSYANEVIEVIRAYDKDAIIIVGTPNWCQYVDQAAKSPITGANAKNVMYALHFYANTHKDSLRGTMQNAIKAGLPIFVSEFGIGSADGNGTVNTAEGNKWIALMDKYNVSYVCWNLANKNEATSLITSGCNKLYNFTESDLSAQGKWLVKVLNGTLDDLGKVDIEDVEEDAEQAGSGGAAVENPSAINYSGTSGGCTVKFTSNNTWTSDGSPCYGLDLSITNNDSTQKSDWKLVITFNDTVSTESFWCAGVAISGKTMTITPESWNSVISAGGNVTGIGMNIKGGSELTIVSISLTFQ